MTAKFGDTFRWFDVLPGDQHLVVMVIGNSFPSVPGRYRCMALTRWGRTSMGYIGEYPLFGSSSWNGHILGNGWTKVDDD